MTKVRSFRVSLIIHAALILIVGALILLGRIYGCNLSFY